MLCINQIDCWAYIITEAELLQCFQRAKYCQTLPVVTDSTAFTKIIIRECVYSSNTAKY